MIIGTLCAIAAYLSGDFFTKELVGEPGNIKETHELFASITMWIMILGSLVRLWIVYKKKEQTYFKWIVFSLYAIGAISVSITGFYGGSLVFNYMIGL